MSDIQKELEFHTDMLVRRFMADGMSEAEARARAAARLGGTDHVQQECQTLSAHLETTTMPNAPWWQSLRQDAAFALRVLRRTPLFTATALLTLAVGIGATTSIFSVVNAVLLRPLPYANAHRIHFVFNAYLQEGLSEAAISTPEFADLRNNTRAFEGFAALRPQDSALTDDCGAGSECEPARVKAYAVSPELFDLLGVPPAHGRGFTHADGVAGVVGGTRVVLLSDGLWRRRYGADPAIIGRTINLSGLARVVVGVMPAGVAFPDDAVGYLKDPADIWIPVSWEDLEDERGNQYLVVLGRLRDGVTPAQAAGDLALMSEGFKTEFPERYAEPRVRWRLGSKPLREEMVGDVRTALIVLFGAVGFVLLIACSNVANLVIARGTTRRRELAVRSALGANRHRLVQQLLVETLMLTSLGAALGVAIAVAGLKVLIAVNPGGIPRITTATIDLPVLMFAAALALATGVIVGLLPAMRQAKADPQSALADGVRGTGVAAPGRSLRGLLVMAEVTIAVVVLVGALLLVRSFIAMSRVPTGVAIDDVAVAQVTIPRATYDTPEKIFGFHRALVERLRAVPGVSRASAGYPLPLSGEGWSGSLAVEGHPEVDGVPEPHAELGVAMPGYFQTVGIPILEGRDFADTDTLAVPRVVVVDTEFARQFWPGESAIGKRVATSGDLVQGPVQTVIGVVGHVRNKGARGASEGQLYMAALQKTEIALYYVARTTGDPRALASGMRGALRETDSRLPVTLLTSGRDLVATFTATDRFNVLLFTVLGGVALVLAAIGLYGVLAFVVSQRTREIGIRLALGGRPGHVVRRVIGEGVGLTLVGLAVGLGAAYLVTRSMADLLFDTEPTDPLTYALVAVLMLVVALLAAVAPARRATRVDPVQVLRQ